MRRSLDLLRRPTIAALLTGVVVAAVCSLASASPLLDGLENQAQDLMQPGAAETGEVVVVAIDRNTLASLGLSWPWPRDVHAELLDAIAVGAPRTVVYDVVFADDGDDEALAASIAAVPTVLAAAADLRRADDVAVIERLVGPNERVGGSALDVGHANVSVADQRGVVRSLPFYAVDRRGVVVPSLAAAAVAADRAPGTYIERADGVQAGDRLVPLEAGELRINFVADLSPALSAIDVMAGDIDPGVFENRIVLVGVTEPTIGDLHLVPPDKSGNFPGLLVHAHAIETVLSRSFLAPAPRVQQAGLVLLVAVASSLAIGRRGLTAGALAAIVSIIAVVLWADWRFSQWGELWDVVWPVIATVVALSAMTVHRYLTNVRLHRRAVAFFGEYVPDNVVQHLSDPRRLSESIEGQRLDVSVLFCDLRGFTPLAASLDPAQVRRLLDAFYGYVSDRVLAEGGTVMQFVGDEVMAVFGAPVAADSAQPASVRAAFRLVDEAHELVDALEALAVPPVGFGVGLHRGPAVAAHVGTSAHRQYNVIGDTVNIASRLCSAAGAGELVASSGAIGEAQLPAPTSTDRLELKGVAQPIDIVRYIGVQRPITDRPIGTSRP